MLTAVKQTVRHHLLNLPGWRTRRKIVVIESDDWGTIRMASKEAFRALLKKGYPVDKCPYNRYDALESDEDVSRLLETLDSVRDSRGNPAILTANNIVANPDFDKIRDSDYQAYFYEPFTETLKRYPAHDKVMELYAEGMRRRLIRMQFHGREHLQVSRWMKALQQADRPARDVFEWRMFSPKHNDSTQEYMDFMDAFDTNGERADLSLSPVVAEGLALFRQIWGHSSDSFIAPCYTWSPDLEPILAQHGVKYLQGISYQRTPVIGVPFQYRNIWHYQGQTNANGQKYLVRNAFFEPSLDPAADWVGKCLKRIAIAFSWNKPAVIGSHRLNYIGYLQPDNRERNLKLLGELLRQIVRRWPQVEFMTSDELGACMSISTNKL